MNDAPRLGAGLPATAAGRVSALGWLLRILLAGYFACALGLMVMRHWVLPNADAYRAEIASAVGEALGLPVSIGRVSAQWSGLHPALQLVEVSISDGHGRSALGLGRVDATLSWASLAPT